VADTSNHHHKGHAVLANFEEAKMTDEFSTCKVQKDVRKRKHIGHVAELVEIEGGVVSGVINLESSGV
jgi:hypothetical protein